ncbi:hypothetical protein N7481_007380 [Penicillium waksmanii]|uniref:uncharacterized protein n=1 Tax=Penicillium waksmanii TaxID=69791 RepID=UPI002549446C|nr:uncharacterized protein N7481_007380 [Penicillium waksmanii]KAJ5980082.1 hypothetical protein N7481_007380 [Penicillium waksmanii]
MIQNLPGELLITIAGYLLYSSDRLHLASCCRRFRLSVPLLKEAYTSINVHYFCEKSLRQLVEILLEAPDLAKRVTRISLAKSKNPPCKSHLSTSHPTHRSCNQSVSDLIQRLTPSDVESKVWMAAATATPGEEYSYLGQDLWLTMLLNCVPNITSLEMEWGGHTEISERFLEFMSRNNGFSCLTEATIQVPFNFGFEFQFYKIAPFFRLQSMHKFKGTLIADLEDQSRVNFADLIPIKSSPIEHIHLVEASSHNGFMPLISACRNLKSFTCLTRSGWAYLDYWAYNMNFIPLLIQDYGQSLMSAKDSLEDLYIDVSYPETNNQLGWIGSLTEYTKLRTLHLRLCDLLHVDLDRIPDYEADGFDSVYDVPTFIPPVDALPVSLEHLYVSDFEWPFSIGLRELEKLVRAKDKFTRLRVIDIEGLWQDELKDVHALTTNLRQAYEEVGVELNVLHYDVEVEHRGKPEVECEDHWSHQIGDIFEFDFT